MAFHRQRLAGRTEPKSQTKAGRRRPTPLRKPEGEPCHAISKRLPDSDFLTWPETEMALFVGCFNS
jgi:hypothetical protein